VKQLCGLLMNSASILEFFSLFTGLRHKNLVSYTSRVFQLVRNQVKPNKIK